jgi:hypothetical protein
MSQLKFVGLLTVAAALGVLLTCAAGAGASAGTSADFCGVSRSVAAQLVSLRSSSGLATASSAKLRAEFSAITAAEPQLRSTAPANIKSDVTRILNLVDVLTGYLKKSNWSVAGLIPHEATLEQSFTRVKPSITKLDTYYRTTCKLHV